MSNGPQITLDRRKIGNVLQDEQRIDEIALAGVVLQLGKEIARPPDDEVTRIRDTSVFSAGSGASNHRNGDIDPDRPLEAASKR